MQDGKETEDESSIVNDEPFASNNDKEKPSSKGEYYYDDAHGYEDFDPEAADEDEDK